jgi:hypothetical protein
LRRRCSVLAATIAAYFAFRRTVRNAALLIETVAFYAWGKARHVPLIPGSVDFNGWIGRQIPAATAPRARKRRPAAVAANVAGRTR